MKTRLKQNNKKDILKFAGIMNGKEADRLQKNVARIRKRTRTRRIWNLSKKSLKIDAVKLIKKTRRKTYS